MVQIEQINNIADGSFSKLIELYVSAFPKKERRELEKLKELINSHPKMFFNAILENEELVGLVIYWHFDSFFYLEHLAVFPEMRNRKIGQKVLDYFAERIQVPQILEVEPSSNEMSERRINFYGRNGFEVCDTDYIQPSYSGLPEECLPLWIMTKPVVDKGSLQEFIRIIKREVYNCK